jgi:hypothetical protein
MPLWIIFTKCRRPMGRSGDSRPRPCCAAFSPRHRATSPRPSQARNTAQPRKRRLRTADHQAVAALDAPHAAGSAGIEVVDAALAQRRGATHVVLEVGVAAVDDRVAGLQARGELVHDALGRRAGGNHDPRRARASRRATNSSSDALPAAPSAARPATASAAAVVHDTGVTGAH